jgi:hypothetical protein
LFITFFLGILSSNYKMQLQHTTEYVESLHGFYGLHTENILYPALKQFKVGLFKMKTKHFLLKYFKPEISCEMI